MFKVCKVCGKAFKTLNATKFCSAYCRAKYQSSTRPKKYKDPYSTLCWTCQNAIGKCSWSARFEPVEGWDTIRNKIRGNNYTGEIIESYKVISCPEYIEDEPKGR